MKPWFRLIALALLFAPAVGYAGCSSVSSTGAAFGNFTGATLSTVGSVTVNCTSGTVFDVTTNSGAHPGGAAYNWNMIGPSSSLLPYGIWLDAAHSQPWGSTPGVDTIHGAGTGASQTFNIYPQIPQNYTGLPGSYTDSILVSVSVGGAVTVMTSPAVTATIAPACTVSAADLSFGMYTGTVINSTTTLTVTCTNSTTYQVGADNGLNAVYIGVWAKYMAGPSGKKLRYHLYTDAARTIEWGSTAGTNEIAGTGAGVAQTITVFGTIGGGSYTSVPGSYSDTVTVTLTY